MLLSSSARHAHAHSSLPRQRASRVAPTTTRPQPLLLHSTTTTTSRHSSCLRASSSASAAAEEQEDKADAAAAVALPPLAAVAAPQTQKQQPDSVPQYSDASSNSNTTTTNNNNVYTKARVRRLSRSWQDSSTPNTGIVAITDRSKVGGAAACVAADFKTSVSATSCAGGRVAAQRQCWLVAGHRLQLAVLRCELASRCRRQDSTTHAQSVFNYSFLPCTYTALTHDHTLLPDTSYLRASHITLSYTHVHSASLESCP